MKPAHVPFAAIASLVAATCLAGANAQDDLRDVITMKKGEPLRGRVFARFDPDAVTVQVGRDRQKVPVGDIAGMDTVRDRAREFFALLDRMPGNLKHRWFMAEWAASHELHDLARLAAMDVVLRDPGHEGAHTMLGHRQKRDEWQWPHDDRWLSFAEIEKVRADWQERWLVDGEHFHVESNADLRRVIDAVMDLERFHVAWFERFGEPLRMYEVVGAKLEVHIWRDEERFPGMRTQTGHRTGKNPYFEQSMHGEAAISHTYFLDARAPRPLRLFEVATSHLLFRTVADNPTFKTFYRPGAWAEVGLAQYLDHSVTGPAGAAAFGAWQIDAAKAGQVLAQRSRDLHHVTQYDTKKLFGSVTDESELEWAAAELAVAYMLAAGQTGGLRDALLGYMLEITRQMKGSSSTALDRHLGQPVEKLDKPWREWIREQIDPPQQPTPPTRGK